MSDQPPDKRSNPDPFAMASRIESRGPAPVHLWDPPFCGDIDMCIRRDGTWVHEGRPIRRPAMVKLFASILKREGDRHYLVTPVEKVGIQVQDCPFLVVDMEVSGSGLEQVITFTTNTGDAFPLSAEHTLEVETDAHSGEPHPCVHVRNDLYALIQRAVFYRLVELAVEKEVGGRPGLGVWSAQTFFTLGQV